MTRPKRKFQGTHVLLVAAAAVITASVAAAFHNSNPELQLAPQLSQTQEGQPKVVSEGRTTTVQLATADGTPQIITAGRAVVQFALSPNETVRMDALTGDLLSVSIPAPNPFPGRNEPTTLIIKSLSYSPSTGRLTMTFPDVIADDNFHCTLEATYNPSTEMWTYQCNSDPQCPTGKTCTLLRNGEPVTVGDGVDDDNTTYSCKCM